MATVTDRGIEKITSDIAHLKRESRQREVGHNLDKRHYGALTRHTGNVVLGLTTLTGTAVVAGLAANDPGTALKILIGILSVSAAIAAAFYERGPYRDLVERNGAAASRFNELNREVRSLDRQWSLGNIVNLDEADRQLTELEKSYDDLEDKSPDVRAYKQARKSVESEEEKARVDAATVPALQVPQ